MAQLNVAKLFVDNNSTEDVIKHLASSLKMNRSIANGGIDTQNPYQAGYALCNVDYAINILSALDEKLNGKKEPTMVQ